MQKLLAIDSRELQALAYSVRCSLNVIEILRSHEQEIKGWFAVRRIGLFGSFVRGEETKDSDIDIQVDFVDRRSGTS